MFTKILGSDKNIDNNVVIYYVFKLIDLRHELMHSKDNTLSDDDMRKAFQMIDKFLRMVKLKITKLDLLMFETPIQSELKQVVFVVVNKSHFL